MFAVGQFVKVTETRHWGANKRYEGVVMEIVEGDPYRLNVRPFGEHHPRALNLTPGQYGRDRAEPLALKNAPAKFTNSQNHALRTLYRAFLESAPRFFRSQVEVKTSTLAVLDKYGLIEPILVGEGWERNRWQLTETGRTVAQPIYGYPGWHGLWEAVNAFYRNNVSWMKELPAMLAVQTYAMDCPDAAIIVRPGYGSESVAYAAQVGGRMVKVDQRDGEYRVLIDVQPGYDGIEGREAAQIAFYIAQAAKLAQRWNAAREQR